MREIRSRGSVEGVVRDGHSYSDCGTGQVKEKEDRDGILEESEAGLSTGADCG